MRSFLLQPYPFSDNLRNKLLVCGGVGLFITLFLALFEPFGFDELSTGIKWQHSLAFGIVTFFISAFLQIVVPRLFPATFREEGWRSWKEIVFLLLTTLLIGAANYGLMLLLYPQNTSIGGFFRAQRITLQVGIFPIVAIVFMKQMTLYRRFVTAAKEASTDIFHQPMHPETGITAQTEIKLQGDNQKENFHLFPDDLLFIASADNYVRVHWWQNGQVKSIMLRSSLKKMEEQLTGHRQFFRCHRMYLVNLQKVQEVNGNAQGLRLHLSGVEDPVPVSRSLTETVRERLHQLSHSPQNS
jgi:DNA-binding LytR/AlgR family response regulator